ncbi:hypothetical protein [Allostreptomyces psammosilenae]|uniref:Uncharacterized protein n=1 Tax=Allostreptomyces psammosilenae TaxID=1892865 RepID=A0A852ZMZ4_9ACTN|nr:hypothetical protein [Allostreptomyces psammosilenae]NYI03783.1 hypothetical protein [Allostreptomyces psammosilenae]
MRHHPRTARLLCDFDSSAAAVRVTSRALRDRPAGALGLAPGSAALAGLASRLPAPVRRGAFVGTASLQASPPSRVSGLRGEDLAAWTADRYGPGPYPAAFVGSVSGAAVHLAAALRAPVLPQTFLVPVRARVDPDRPDVALRAGRALGEHLVEANPELALCHMHDPNQDRAMLVRFLYYRFKRLRLGRTLTRFLEQRLAPGATIFVVDCTLTWPTTRLGDRQRFQFGALGGMSPQEYAAGGDPVARYLAAQGSPLRRWPAPPTDERYPEAEWGYDDTLTADVAALAARRGFRVRRIRVAEPEHLSPLVADLHRWWYARRGLPADRLLVETYNQWEPYWAARLGAVPFWLQFTTRPSYRTLTRYLCRAEQYDRVDVNLFSNGVRSIGLVPAARWRGLADRCARLAGGTIGVDERTFPEDIGSTLRYGPALAAQPRHLPPPSPLTLAELDEFLDQAGDGEPARMARFEPVRPDSG